MLKSQPKEWEKFLWVDKIKLDQATEETQDGRRPDRKLNQSTKA